MSELSNLISRLQRGIKRNASYMMTIKHPTLLVASLQELNDLIGNDKVKDSVATQITHLIMMKKRALDNPNIKEDNVMLNTVLYGPPGVGKTLVGTKLAKIWYSLGYLDGSNNLKVKKQEFGEILKDMLKNSGTNNGSTTDDNTLALYIMLIFIVIFILLISMTWSFYSKFGGMWTLAMIVLIVLVILFVGYYVSSVVNSDNDSSTDAIKNDNKNKDRNGKNSPINTSSTQDPATIHNKNESNDYGNSPVIEAFPSDDQVIKIVNRSDFVDKYVGWSDKKALRLLEENLGKVLFVDEAYSLVTDMHDSFGMEILTTLNLFLSQHPKEIIVIFAGYKDLMEAGIFSFQPGLRRRFMWQFHCNGYNGDQLYQIFKMQLNNKGWGITDEQPTLLLFHQNIEAFPAFGGDTERLTFFAELEHSRDFMSNEQGMTSDRLNSDHVRRGMIKLIENNIQSEPEAGSSNPMVNMMKLFNGKNQQNLATDPNVLNLFRNNATERAYQ